MSSFIKPDDCEYHNSPYKKLELDDGSYARITKSALNGQPLLAVATRTYKHTTNGMEPDLVLLDVPISNCPFCGAKLLGEKSSNND